MKNFILIFLCSFLLANISYGQLHSNFVLPVTPTGSTNVGIGLNNPAVDLHLIGAEVRFENNNFSTGSGNFVSSSFLSGGLGRDNVIDGSRWSFGLGSENQVINSEGSTAIGDRNNVMNGYASVAIGGDGFLDGDYTFTMGLDLQSVGSNIITMGRSVGNGTPNSFMVGYGTPNLFVDGNSGFTGINTNAPQQALDVNGVIRSTALLGGGSVCANGNGELYISSPVCGGGGLPDNLGNHIATQPLDMSCFDIFNTGNIKFCNGTALDQSTAGALVVQGGAFGVGINPLTAPFGPHMLAANGSIFGTALYITSDRKFKKNIEQLPNALNNVMKLRGYNYEYDKSNENFEFETGKTNGFIAQELQEIYPDLVKDEGDFLSVNYVGLIPVLTEAIKEQQSIIEANASETKALKDELNELKAMVNSICSNGCGEIGMIKSTNPNEIGGADEMRLLQNTPNPFNSTTTIEYYVPAKSNNAALYIYDLQGRQIESFDISERGNGKIEINAGDLLNGMYYYGLLVDGKASPTLKMILTN